MRWLKMEQRIIFLDIDGTLTEPGSNEPPESALRAVRQAQREGHCVFLCSGRCHAMLRPLLQYGFDGAVASSGGYIEYRGKVIYDCPMTERQKQATMGILKENGIFRTVECMDGAYTDEEFKDFLRNYTDGGDNSELLRWREQLESSLNIRPMSEYREQPIYKIVIVSQTMRQVLTAQEALASDFAFCIQEKGMGNLVNGEVVNRAFDKGKAVRRVCEYLRIPVSRAVAFGDSMNDKEMLEEAGLSICMENGSEAVKSLADDICPPVCEDGLLEGFFKHHLIHSVEVI